MREIARALVAWFRVGHRQMPWRESRDPYAIWVSEIMLQQTRVETVRGYYTRWMARLPTVRALAEAPLDEVLSLWSGLGYYARARNLKAAAELLTVRDGGAVPRDPAALLALPGVGAYTAGAIASIAYGLPEPILDGNVARVLSRLFAIDAPAAAASTKAQLWALARELVPEDAPSEFNQAMMELGATVCTPRSPRCLTCPVAASCRARAAGIQEELPRKRVRKEPRTVEAIALVARCKGRVLLGRRPARGLWGGLWEPPWMPVAPGSDIEAMAATFPSSELGLRLTGRTELTTLTHELTHRRYRFHVLSGRARSERAHDVHTRYEALRWVEPTTLPTVGIAAWAARVLRTSDGD